MSIRDNPGPMDYAADELVEVRLHPHPEIAPAWFPARVTRRSTTHLHVRVTGSGNEIALSLWNTKALVRRRSP